MAKPIKDTPTLHGKDAQRFFEKMEASSKATIPDSRIAQIRSAMERIKFVEPNKPVAATLTKH